ncbi:16S rRNA (guanine(966)-N(2))-methyltransferase RsmD [Ruania halotolerans]|uniref:16S rRNA (guanine(966)-N(2))-methyltransferase RsmD n=1 Tax=Ruania halotolerans TaxID=2897773 RepID=UPI001E57B40F|nr:16S rRNA (guanine(966)-N(2))-methyltransferase RsmD [Ruania halotolerans]UFU07839.1 16S rRNA (guanine(966)-N(2))-methyltransferase RsmD [Ruania halotolerans]
MTRIVAGSAGGRRLDVPPRGTRPTSERVREAVFSRLEHLGVIEGARVLDLYAGSGALGLEAVSRGAREVALVESGRLAATVCRDNARRAGLSDRVRVYPVTVGKHLAAGPPGAGYDLVLIDPPYDLDEIDRVLAALAGPGWLAPQATIVLERSSRSPAPVWPKGWTEDGEKAYGDTVVSYAVGP